MAEMPGEGAVLRPRAARTLRRRADIVDRAAQIFAEHGYGNVGMRDIADAVGIRGASLYHHFPSKEEILYAVFLTVTREPCEENLPLLDGPGTPAERMIALVAGHLEHLHRRNVEHVVGMREPASLTPEHLADVVDHRRYYQRRVRDAIAAGVRSGDFTVSDPQLAAFVLLDALNGVASWYRPDRDLGVEGTTEGYVDLLVSRMLGAASR